MLFIIFFLAKNYDLSLHQSLPLQSKLSTGEKSREEKIEFIPDTLLTQLNSLNLGEIDVSDSDKEDDEVDATVSFCIHFFVFKKFSFNAIVCK